MHATMNYGQLAWPLFIVFFVFMLPQFTTAFWYEYFESKREEILPHGGAQKGKDGGDDGKLFVPFCDDAAGEETVSKDEWEILRKLDETQPLLDNVEEEISKLPPPSPAHPNFQKYVLKTAEAGISRQHHDGSRKNDHGFVDTFRKSFHGAKMRWANLKKEMRTGQRFTLLKTAPMFVEAYKTLMAKNPLWASFLHYLSGDVVIAKKMMLGETRLDGGGILKTIRAHIKETMEMMVDEEKGRQDKIELGQLEPFPMNTFGDYFSIIKASGKFIVDSLRTVKKAKGECKKADDEGKREKKNRRNVFRLMKTFVQEETYFGPDLKKGKNRRRRRRRRQTGLETPLIIFAIIIVGVLIGIGICKLMGRNRTASGEKIGG